MNEFLNELSELLKKHNAELTLTNKDGSILIDVPGFEYAYRKELK